MAQSQAVDESLPVPLPKIPTSDSSQSDCPEQIVTECQSECFVPRLRRTKSVFMKDIDLEDPSELYDSASSGDEYVPDSAGSDGDESCGRRSSQALFDMINLSVSVGSPVCDSTTQDNMPLDLVGETCEFVEEEEPCSSQSINRETCEVTEEEEPSSSQSINNNVFVRAPHKRDGIRVYDKKHYCLYCSKPYPKIARHLEHAHENKPDVAKALSFPKGSKQRKMHLDFLRNRGNYAHNASVMKSGTGELVPFKRPPKGGQGSDFMHCAFCQGLFTRKVLWRHMRACRLKPGTDKPKPGRNRVQSLCTYTAAVPSNISKQMWGVISAMNPDPVTEIIKNDEVIINFGQHLLNKGGMSAKNQQQVREKMRELGRLIHNARKVTTLKVMEDFVKPQKYIETVKAVKATCGYDSETNMFRIPSLANKLGNSLVKISKLLKAQALISNNVEMVKNASDFQDIHQEKWNEMISATALRNIREAKWNVPALMPFTEDVQGMHAYLTQVQDEWFDTLSENPSGKAWSELAKVCLVQTIFFNRRREGEVAGMPLSAFTNRDTSDPHEDVDWALSEVEKKLCRHFTRIIVRGKRGRPVPILLTPKMLNAAELLVKQREACGVLKENEYMFARPCAMTHFRGSDCIRDFAKRCGAKCPQSLTSTKLRKHAATLSTVLNLTDTEMDQLANFLGHDIRIHREFYRLPEKTLQLAKISKLLMALEQGRISEFHGKNLDEITIEPHERALESDEDGQSQENYPSTDGYNTSHQLDEPSTEESVLSEVMLPTPSRKRKLSSQPSSTSAVLDDAPSRPSVRKESVLSEVMLPTPSRKRKLSSQPSSTSAVLDDAPSRPSVRKPSTEESVLSEVMLPTPSRKRKLSSQPSSTSAVLDDAPSRPSVRKESVLSEVMLPTPSRKRKLSSQPSSTSAVLDDAPSRPSVRTLSGKATQKKSPWTQTEIRAVERHLMKFISSCMVPGKWECERCLRAEPEALKNRNWQTLKYYVYNRITAIKRATD
ncbi:uncharacterized protein ACNS7B_004605 isoform 1-T1 [Menidia menidia]